MRVGNETERMTKGISEPISEIKLRLGFAEHCRCNSNGYISLHINLGSNEELFFGVSDLHGR